MQRNALKCGGMQWLGRWEFLADETAPNLHPAGDWRKNPFHGRTRPADFFTAFVLIYDREETQWHKDDWPYPVRWRPGDNEVSSAALDFWFSTRGCP